MSGKAAQTVAGSEVAPSAAWVRFLRSYGPTPNNLTMFDEYVSGALSRARVQPIRLSTPMLDEMVEHVESGSPGSVLIAGTAGDGKTYHCRALWARIGGDEKVWAEKGNIKEHRLTEGRLAVFIKDLSEFNGEESDLPLQRLEKSVLGGDDTEVVVLAANHGQLLDRLRDLGKRQGRLHPLRKPLQESFLQAAPAPDRLAIFDLSRTTSRFTKSLKQWQGIPNGITARAAPSNPAIRYARSMRIAAACSATPMVGSSPAGWVTYLRSPGSTGCTFRCAIYWPCAPTWFLATRTRIWSRRTS